MTPRLSTAPNFRDLGGVPTADGGTVRRGLVYRSEALLHPTEEDAAALSALGIALVCDLRSDTEREHAPNGWWAAHGIERLDLDVLAGIRTEHGPWSLLRADRGAAGGIAAMEAIYRAMPAAAGLHLVTLLDRAAAGDLPLLIHCTAGKDRTGFVSAVLLVALGVPFDAVVADYLDSAGRRTDQVREGTRQMVLDRVGPGVSEEALDALMGVERRYLEASFEMIRHDHGGVEAYLAASGFGADRLRDLRARLVG